jgi:drug/metabolite transporter (DMT)-like permease
MSILQVFTQYALFYTGLNLVPGSLGAMIIGSSPLFVALVAHFMVHNDKMTPLKTGSILVGVAGIVIITVGRQGIPEKGEAEILGIILLLVNNLVAGFSNVLISKHSGGISPMVLSSGSLILGGLLLIGVSLPVEGIPPRSFPPAYYYALAWLSFLSAAAMTIWYTLLKRPGVKVSLLNAWKFLIPVSGAALSWILITEEKPDVPSVAGMAVIGLSLSLLNYANRKHPSTKTTPS